jgi:hypothetical protein
LKALFNIVKHWQIRDEDARELLGGISNSAYYQLKQNTGASVKALEQDRLLRISYLIGIFKSLNILYSQRLADQWMQLPNTNPIFAGPHRLTTYCTEVRRRWMWCAGCSMRAAAAAKAIGHGFPSSDRSAPLRYPPAVAGQVLS